MPVEIPKDTWPGSVRTVTLGAVAADGGTRSHTIIIGGHKTLPFMNFEQPTVHRPVVALEIKDRRPDDWSTLLLDLWGQAANDPASWAKAAEAAGAVGDAEAAAFEIAREPVPDEDVLRRDAGLLEPLAHGFHQHHAHLRRHQRHVLGRAHHPQ